MAPFTRPRTVVSDHVVYFSNSCGLVSDQITVLHAYHLVSHRVARYLKPHLVSPRAAQMLVHGDRSQMAAQLWFASSIDRPLQSHHIMTHMQHDTMMTERLPTSVPVATAFLTANGCQRQHPREVQAADVLKGATSVADACAALARRMCSECAAVSSSHRDDQPRIAQQVCI